jgi:hypothetical protein
MEQRLFIELANLERITPEWVEEKQGFGFNRTPFEPQLKSIGLCQRAIRESAHRIMLGKTPTKSALRDLNALTDPFTFQPPYQLEGHLISPVAIEAAKDFLGFYSNESQQHIGRCPWCLRFFIGRSNKKYCTPQHGTSYNNARKVASGYSKEKMREYREKYPLKYM